jgi:hypothetical protein
MTASEEPNIQERFEATNLLAYRALYQVERAGRGGDAPALSCGDERP